MATLKRFAIAITWSIAICVVLDLAGLLPANPLLRGLLVGAIFGVLSFFYTIARLMAADVRKARNLPDWDAIEAELNRQ